MDLLLAHGAQANIKNNVRKIAIFFYQFEVIEIERRHYVSILIPWYVTQLLNICSEWNDSAYDCWGKQSYTCGS